MNAVFYPTLILLALATSCSGDEGPPGPAGPRGESGPRGDAGAQGEPGSCGTNEILLTGANFFPEGIAQSGDTLYIGSFATGQIVRSHTCDSFAEPFAQTSRSALGLVVDEANSVLWACDTDTSGDSGSDIVGFALEDGSEVARHAIPGGGFCNDLILDSAGNLYATEAFGGRVLRVEADEMLTEDPAEEFVVDPALGPQPGGQGFGANGITVDSEDRLYVATVDTGGLYRIPTEGTPRVEAIALDRPLNAGDGLELADDRTLFVVEIFDSAISRIRLDGDDLTAGTVSHAVTRADAPATFTLDGDTAWIVEGQLDHLFGFDDSPPILPFRVVRFPVEL